MILIYTLIALFASVAGAVSGMGGGSLMKPIFDVLHHYDATEIAAMTSCTVFVMALVSVALGRRTGSEDKIKTSDTVALAVGSVIGGYVGQAIFKLCTASVSDGAVKVVQNVVLILVIALIFAYMSKKGERKTLNKSGIWIALPVGGVLGILSSFLGIGGGPMNVAVFIFVFGYGMISSALCSLITIIFSQAAKLVTMLITGGTAVFALPIIPFVAVGGVLGALLGKLIGKRLSEHGAKICFLVVQSIILLLCVFNVIRYAVSV